MKNSNKKIYGLSLLAAMLALPCTNALADWNITDLGAALTTTGSGITGGSGFSLNNYGDVVGQANFANTGNYHAAYWHSGTVYDLGVLGNPLLSSQASTAHYITDSGLIVGEAYSATTSTTNNYRQAVTFSLSGAPQNIHSTMGYNANNSVAVAAGNGAIIGQAYNDNISVNHAVIWKDGTAGSATDMNPTGYTSTASSLRAINNSGQMAGYSVPVSIGYSRPTLWNMDGTVSYLNIASDSKYSGQNWGGISGYALDINDSGQIPVWYTNGIGGIWQNGIFTEITNHFGYFGLHLQAINNSGFAVGSVYTSNGNTGGSRAVMYDSKTGTLMDLGALLEGSGWYLTGAADINDKGQILVTANKSGFDQLNSASTTLLLTPGAATPTPIPAALPLFASGLAALGVCKRKFFREKNFTI